MFTNRGIRLRESGVFQEGGKPWREGGTVPESSAAEIRERKGRDGRETNPGKPRETAGPQS